MNLPRPHPPRCSPLALALALAGALAGTHTGLDARDRPEGPPTPADPGRAEAPAPPALALAEVYTGAADLADYWVSEKLDGVRAYWDGARLTSRGGHPIRTPAGFTAGFPAEPMDGELWLGRGRFEEVSGLARRDRPDPAAWREVRYVVFDLPAAPGGFAARLGRLAALVRAAGNPALELLEQTRASDHAALMARMAAVVAAGGEGLMLRRETGPYRPGRSADLLKVKPYEDAEARVVGHIPGKGKYTGMLGALEVEDGEGRRFAIGTGLSDAERRAPPPVGSTVTYRFQGRTERGIPRFASFLRVRAD
jgi:DNA ligase-1